MDPPPPPPPLLPPLPPQPIATPATISRTIISGSMRIHGTFFLRPKTHNAPAAKIATVAAPPDFVPGRHGIVSAPEAVVVAIVSVVVPAAPFGVTVVGLNVQVPPVGKPVQAKLTAELNPFVGVTVIVVIVDAPAVTVALAGLAPIVNDGVAALTVTVTAAEVDPAKFVSPAYTAVTASDPTGSAVVEKVATPLFRVWLPRFVVPFMNVTVPVGVPVPPFAGVTVSVNVTLAPLVIVIGAAVSTLVVAGSVCVVTVTAKAGEVLAANVVFPVYAAVMEWTPTASVLVEYVPCPDALSATVASAVVPSLNVTLPAGVEEADTVAVNVTLLPCVTVVPGDAVTVVVVGVSVLVAPRLIRTADPATRSGLPSLLKSAVSAAPSRIRSIPSAGPTVPL